MWKKKKKEKKLLSLFIFSRGKFAAGDKRKNEGGKSKEGKERINDIEKNYKIVFLFCSGFVKITCKDNSMKKKMEKMAGWILFCPPIL